MASLMMGIDDVLEARIVPGPVTGRAYAFSRSESVQAVLAADAEELERTGFFRRVGSGLSVAQGAGRFGTMGRNVFHGPGLVNADISLAKKLLQWSPTVDLDEGLRRTTAYFRELLTT